MMCWILLSKHVSQGYRTPNRLRLLFCATGQVLIAGTMHDTGGWAARSGPR